MKEICQPRVAQRYSCGEKILVLARRPYEREHHCERWTCGDCRAYKIKQFQAELRNAGLAVTCFVLERPPTRRESEVKTLSNFIAREIRGDYWAIRSDLRAVIISKNRIPGAVRLRSKYAIETFVNDLLNEDWSVMFKKRITRSHGQKSPPEKNADPAYAQLRTSDVSPAIVQQFADLKNDRQRAQWLIQHTSDVVLFNRGKKIIEEFRAADIAF
jgi:hypothetical protein